MEVLAITRVMTSFLEPSCCECESHQQPGMQMVTRLMLREVATTPENIFCRLGSFRQDPNASMTAECEYDCRIRTTTRVLGNSGTGLLMA
jgi:hypothetical protein